MVALGGRLRRPPAGGIEARQLKPDVHLFFTKSEQSQEPKSVWWKRFCDLLLLFLIPEEGGAFLWFPPRKAMLGCIRACLTFFTVQTARYIVPHESQGFRTRLHNLASSSHIVVCRYGLRSDPTFLSTLHEGATKLFHFTS